MDILLIDDTCTLCNKTVAFISARGGDDKFRYISLYSVKGEEILQKYGFSSGYNKSVVLIQNQKAYTQSDAVLKVLKQLKGGWQVLYAFMIIPKPFRDWVYGLVSRYRDSLIK